MCVGVLLQKEAMLQQMCDENDALGREIERMQVRVLGQLLAALQSCPLLQETGPVTCHRHKTPGSWPDPLPACLPAS
jgi:hypothetical protein